MVAAIIDTLPISKPLKKHRYPAEYTTAAMGRRKMTRAGKWKWTEKTKRSASMDSKPAIWDQKKDLKGPICLEYTPPRKS
jgi:hypothetical protein